MRTVREEPDFAPATAPPHSERSRETDQAASVQHLQQGVQHPQQPAQPQKHLPPGPAAAHPVVEQRVRGRRLRRRPSAPVEEGRGGPRLLRLLNIRKTLYNDVDRAAPSPTIISAYAI
jgi:hypothetical protein